MLKPREDFLGGDGLHASGVHILDPLLDVYDLIRQYQANGIRYDQFIRAIAWSKEPALRAAVLKLFRRAGSKPADLPGFP